MRYSVLFVCLGNICRSPMAEAVFRHKLKEAGLDGIVAVDSAGTGDWHAGEPPHAGTRRVLGTRGISCEGMRARQLTAEDGDRYDLIVAMDRANEKAVRRVVPSGSNAEIIRFLSLLPEKGMEDVPDPYYTGNFEEVYDLVAEGCERLLSKVQALLKQ